MTPSYRCGVWGHKLLIMHNTNLSSSLESLCFLVQYQTPNTAIITVIIMMVVVVVPVVAV